jgi:hypothetical protein
VAAEVAAMVGGGVGAMAWVGRRRRRGGRSAPSSARLVVMTSAARGGSSEQADTDTGAVLDDSGDRSPGASDGVVPIRL